MRRHGDTIALHLHCSHSSFNGNDSELQDARAETQPTVPFVIRSIQERTNAGCTATPCAQHGTWTTVDRGDTCTDRVGS